MDWEGDIDHLTNKKIVKQGRRAINSRSPDSTEQLLDNALETITNASPSENTCKAGGWADDAIRSAKSRGNAIEDQRFQVQVVHNDIEDDDDIPIIPDIDDLQDSIQTLSEIKAPTILINRSTYNELDKELSAMQTSPTLQFFNKSNGVNLSLLNKKLCPEKDVKEVDEEWTMEGLFRDLVSTNTTI